LAGPEPRVIWCIPKFLDSSTIRVLVDTAKDAEVAGVAFALVLADGSIVEKALAVTGVLETLNRVRALEEALVE